MRKTVLAKKGRIAKTDHDGDAFTLAEKNTFFHHNPALKGGYRQEAPGERHSGQHYRVKR